MDRPSPATFRAPRNAAPMPVPPTPAGLMTTRPEALGFPFGPFSADPLSAVPLSPVPLTPVPLSPVPLSAAPLSPVEVSPFRASPPEVSHAGVSPFPFARFPLTVTPFALAVLLLGACGSGGGDGPFGSSVTAAPTSPAPPQGQLVSFPVPSPPAPADADSPDTESDTDPNAGPDTEPNAEPDALPRVDVRDIDAIYPYVRDGRYADVLADCARVEQSFDACPLASLPFIVQEVPSPGVDDVMARVLVTHDWMGERFEAVLRGRGEELLPLFGAVTSITIGSTVRPSNYWSGTGGIQLDPAGLWLTLEEKANVSIVEDFRAPFRTKLAFRNLYTMRIDGESIFSRFGLEDRNERPFEEIERPMMSLLFHELAHANDYLPPGTASELPSNLPPFDALQRVAERRLSEDLAARSPLNSDLLIELANIRFRPNEPTAAQRDVSGTVAGAEMSADGATDFYSYSTIREDFANLFEALQMKRVFDADVHVGFSSQPPDPEDYRCSDLPIEWGVLNRLGNPTVALRARDVTEAIYGPDPTLDAFLAAQENTERAMEAGVDWCTNLDRARPADALAATSARARSAPGGTSAGSIEDSAELTHAERHAVMDERRREP